MSITDELREWGERWESIVACEIEELADRIDAENAKLRRERDFYFQQVAENGRRFDESLALLESENEKLRELVRDYFNAPCFECDPWADGWEGCEHCESYNCTLAIRTLELGIEVEE